MCNLLRRCYDLQRRLQVPSAASVGVGESQPPQTLLDEGAVHGPMASASLSKSRSPFMMEFGTCFLAWHLCVMRSFLSFLYAQDHNDPTTFPGYRGGPHLLDFSSTYASAIVHRNKKYSGHADLPATGQGISRPPHCLISFFEATAGVWDRALLVFSNFSPQLTGSDSIGSSCFFTAFL